MGLDRLSTYFDEAEHYGLGNVRPLPSYASVYPLPPGVVEGMAYSFDFDVEEPRSMAAYRFRLRREVERWRHEQDAGEPRMTITAEGAPAVLDTRPGAPAGPRVLDDVEVRILRECDDICARGRLLALASSQGTLGPFRVEEHLRRLEAERLLVAIGDRYLSLVLPRAGAERAASADVTSSAAGSAPSRQKSS